MSCLSLHDYLYGLLQEVSSERKRKKTATWDIIIMGGGVATSSSGHALLVTIDLM